MTMATLVPMRSAADTLGICERQLRRLIRSGEVAAINVGTGERPSWRFHPNDIEDFIARRSAPAAPAQTPRPLYAAKPSPAVRKGSVVYFFRSGPFIKIGTTMNLKHRLQNVQTSHPTPIVLAGSTKGDKRLERELHRRFAALRVNGEWFREVDDLAVYVANLAEGL
ncbi:MAG: GIY-YIG nuclease family protein [Bosea sp.]|uniref:GIY-YIG nuclease family protein n=1 Tax=Bosea sp. (in: a-proteobacteria) TaxID=1871050 RepID=UPI001ACBB46F|nr:GIY-YIG nuclease family protein [Bosea sp. (in: a-proteobacteria)]MBN9469964.1 GIY-YIG nuclease family protein [Bosea sp. (in: a-proteobacteria)]